MTVYNHAFHGVTHARALRFRVNQDIHGLVHVSRLVDIHVADAVEVLNHRNLALFDNGANQAFATAGNHEVDAVIALQKQTHQVVARFGHQLHGIFINAIFGESLVENPGEELGGIQRFLTTAQNHGIASLKAKACTIYRHVGATFENKEHGTDRHSHAANLDAVLEFAAFKDTVQRVGKGGDFFGPLGHRLNTGIIQSKAIHLGVIELAGGGFEVQFICCKDFRLLFAQELSNTIQHGATLFSRQGAECLTRFFCILR